ncbi:MAG: hypothetical protein SF069_07700 [Phycisphaerae bacterium]|nr:hypothetical protein [Phycisphaerae bacterium]
MARSVAVSGKNNGLNSHTILTDIDSRLTYAELPNAGYDNIDHITTRCDAAN